MAPVRSALLRDFSVQRVNDSHSERITDKVATEEPLEIRIQYAFKDATRAESLAVTMRTPGADRELAAGLLVSEGVVRSPADLVSVRALGIEPSNEVLVTVSANVDFEAWRASRTGFVSSSCGICGKRSVDAITAEVNAAPAGDFRLSRESIYRLPELLGLLQKGFTQTGGLHAAALIDSRGELRQIFEDVGRHNALDKLIGWSLLNGRFPLHGYLLFLSSRSSFELIQKAAMAGAPALATVGGPSSLAIEAARRYGITLIGFVRERRFNVYAGEWRIGL